MPLPEAALPLLRITRGPEKEVPWTQDGLYERSTPYTFELYDYAADPVTRADSFADLAEALRERLRGDNTLSGMADTSRTKVVNVTFLPRPIGGSGPRPMSKTKGLSLLHERWGWLVKEAVQSL